MSVLDLDMELDLKEYYINKIVKFFTKHGPHGRGLEMESDSRKRKIITNDIFCDIPLETILDRQDCFQLYYFRKYSQIDIHLAILDSRDSNRIKKFERAGWHRAWEKDKEWWHGGRLVPITLKYILNYERMADR